MHLNHYNDAPKDIAVAIRGNVDRWSAGRGDDPALHRLLQLRTRIEMEWLFEVEASASQRLEDPGALVWLKTVADLPMSDVEAGLTDPLCSLWLRRAQETLTSAVATDGELRRVLDGFLGPALTSLSSAEATAELIIAEVPARLSIPSLAVEVVRPQSGPLRIEVRDGIIVLDEGVATIAPDGIIRVQDNADLAVSPLPKADGYGVRLEAHEPHLRELFPWIDDGDYQPDLWVQRLNASAALLKAHHPEMLAEMRHNLKVVVPTSPGPSARHSTGNYRDARGAVNSSMYSEPFFSDGLIHEHRHDLLNSISMVVPVFETEDRAQIERYYSPWRPEPRPIIGLLHAVFVFVEVCEFYLRLLADSPGYLEDSHEAVRMELGLQTVRLGLGVAEMQDAEGLTPFGRDLLEALGQRAKALRADAARHNAFADRQILKILTDHYKQYVKEWSVTAHTDIDAGIRKWTT